MSIAPPLTAARRAVLECLGRLDEGVNLADSFEPCCEALSARDRALAWELLHGTVRHRLTLDYLVDHFIRAEPAQVPPLLRRILRSSAYELVFMGGIPAYAAISQAVEAARALVSQRSAGFANAVLRALQAELGDLGDSESDSRTTLPVARADRQLAPEQGTQPSPEVEWRFLQFRSPLFPGAEADSARSLSVRTSHPLWLVRRWVKRFGYESTRLICLANNSLPWHWLAVHPERADPASLAAELAREGIEAAVEGPRRAVRVRRLHGLRSWASYRQGKFQLFGEMAIEVMERLRWDGVEKVLDFCAAPGGKSVLAAWRLPAQRSLVAMDVSRPRLVRIRENWSRLGLGSIALVVGDGRRPPFGAAGSGYFDRVVCDVPCSNSGVLSRRVEARWRMTEGSLRRLSRLQGELLARAARFVCAGGFLAYVTCSLEPEENEGVVERFLAGQGGFGLSEKVFQRPGLEGVEGGFFALLRRSPTDVTVPAGLTSRENPGRITTCELAADQ